MPSISWVRSEARAVAGTTRDADLERLARAVEALAGAVADVEKTAKDAADEARSAKREARR